MAFSKCLTRKLADNSIEVPSDFGIPVASIFDELSEDQRRPALVYLIEQLPKVSEIKASLQNGVRLALIGAPPGSIGVLRWVIGSCKAYLKEVKTGEGLSTGVWDRHGQYSPQNLRQFRFVVGSPEQEANFKDEIRLAQNTNPNCNAYPTLLAFHGKCILIDWADLRLRH